MFIQLENNSFINANNISSITLIDNRDFDQEGYKYLFILNNIDEIRTIKINDSLEDEEMQLTHFNQYLYESYVSETFETKKQAEDWFQSTVGIFCSQNTKLN